MLCVACDAQQQPVDVEPPVEPPEYALVLSHTAHDFGQIRVGEATEALTVTVRNGWSEPLSNLAARIEPPDSGYVIMADTCRGQLQPSAVCEVSVAFEPRHAGSTQSMLVVDASGTSASAMLMGLSTATLQVVSLSAVDGAAPLTVVSNPPGLICNSSCEGTFAVSQVELSFSAADPGFAEWTGDCQVDGSTCTVHLDGNKTVTLELLSDGPSPVWRVSVAASTGALIDAMNNVIVGGIGSLTKLGSRGGGMLWQTLLETDGGHIAMDHARTGNIATLGASNGRVTVVSAEGQLLWRKTVPMEGAQNWSGLVFDRAGNLYIAGYSNANNSPYVPWLAKYRGDGTLEWTRSYDIAESALFRVLEMAPDGLVRVSAVGGTRSPDGSSMSIDISVILAMDAAGEIIEQIPVSTTELLRIDSTGNMFTAGVSAYAGIAKLSPTGEHIWAVANRPAGWIAAIALSPDGDLFVAGTRLTNNSQPIHPWLARVRDMDGTIDWVMELDMDSTLRGAMARGLAVDGNGDIIVTVYKRGGGEGVYKFAAGQVGLLR